MKNLFLASMMLISTFAVADEVSVSAAVKVGRQAQPVRVNSVSTEGVGAHGFPSTRVLVSATFGNSCEVPRPSELVTIPQYSRNFDTLVLALGSESQRACPAVYMPVTVTLDLGTYTKPNDGLFRKITVNGKAAQ